MSRKLKKFFPSLLKKKIFFLVLIIGGLLSPLYSVQAAFKWYYLMPAYWYIKGAGAITGWSTDLIATKLGAFIATLATMFLQIPLFFANVFLAIAAVLLDIVTRPAFINLPYTKLDNPIIRMGWTVTRDLANMGIVLALVVIGLATILRIESYQAKKTLPILIIIALLINFTPVLLGIVVDASNILMDFFLKGSLETSGFIELMKGQWDVVGNAWKEAAEAEIPAQILAPLGETVALTFYGFITGFIFLVFAFLFVMRYIVIWILVILSPLAFAAYILPATKKYFDQWWKQFLNWCFIGVCAAFFLYLSNGLLFLAQGGKLYEQKGLPIEKIVPQGITDSPDAILPGLLDSILPYCVIVGFLVVGLVATLSISAYGASSIVNFAKSKGKAAAKGGWRGTKTMGAATLGAIRGAKEGEGIKGRIKEAAKGAATYEGREKGREVMGKMLEKMHLVRPGAYETTRRKRWKIEEEVKRLDTLPTDRLRDITERTAIGPTDIRGKIGAFEVLAKRRAFKDTDKERKLLPKMQSLGADTKEVLKAMPHWAPLIGKRINEQVMTTSAPDFTKTQTEALKNPDVLLAFISDIAKVRYMGNRGSGSQKEAIGKSLLTPGSDARNKIDQKIKELLKAGKRDEAGRIIKALEEIATNPNFRV